MHLPDIFKFCFLEIFCLENGKKLIHLKCNHNKVENYEPLNKIEKQQFLWLHSFFPLCTHSTGKCVNNTMGINGNVKVELKKLIKPDQTEN